MNNFSSNLHNGMEHVHQRIDNVEDKIQELIYSIQQSSTWLLFLIVSCICVALLFECLFSNFFFILIVVSDLYFICIRIKMFYACLRLVLFYHLHDINYIYENFVHLIILVEIFDSQICLQLQFSSNNNQYQLLLVHIIRNFNSNYTNTSHMKISKIN